MKVSIIMPVYNAAGTLPVTLASIREQSFRDFELVFVDDCSTDASSEVMADFAADSGIHCRIVRQPVNGGVAAARNRGLAAAEGEFVVFVDADDRMTPRQLETAVAKAEGADIVGWDWTLGFEKNGRYMRQADYGTPEEALRNLMCGTMRWNLWMFMYRRSLLVDGGIGFIDGANMGEDMNFTIRAYLHAGKVVQIHESLYIYNAVSTGSISRQFNEDRRREVSANILCVEKAIEASDYAGRLMEYVQFLKLNIKLPLIISDDRANYETWYSWMSESNAYVMDNKALPLRTRLVQLMASRRFWLGLKAYYVLVYRLVYGVIYR